MLQMPGTADEDWWPCGCFGARARKQVCSFVYHCHRKPLCGHRTALKMSHVAFVKKKAAAIQPWVHSHPFKTKSFIAVVRLQQLVRASTTSLNTVQDSALQPPTLRALEKCVGGFAEGTRLTAVGRKSGHGAAYRLNTYAVSADVETR
jgi:hypothetical protein